LESSADGIEWRCSLQPSIIENVSPAMLLATSAKENIVSFT